MSTTMSIAGSGVSKHTAAARSLEAERQYSSNAIVRSIEYLPQWLNWIFSHTSRRRRSTAIAPATTHSPQRWLSGGFELEPPTPLWPKGATCEENALGLGSRGAPDIHDAEEIPTRSVGCGMWSMRTTLASCTRVERIQLVAEHAATSFRCGRLGFWDQTELWIDPQICHAAAALLVSGWVYEAAEAE